MLQQPYGHGNVNGAEAQGSAQLAESKPVIMSRSMADNKVHMLRQQRSETWTAPR